MVLSFGKFWHCELESNGTDLESFDTVIYITETVGAVPEPLKILVMRSKL